MAFSAEQRSGINFNSQRFAFMLPFVALNREVNRSIIF